jgi:hypothetical protein
LARQRSCAAVPRIRDAIVPLRPATASEPTNAASPPSSSNSATTSRGEVRLERDRPEPSVIRGAMPSSSSSSRMTAAPAAVLPRSPNCAPSTLMSISAMKLSDGWFISRSSSAAGWERQAPTATASFGVRPRRARRSMSTPSPRSCLVNARAAKFAGRRCQ